MFGAIGAHIKSESSDICQVLSNLSNKTDEIATFLDLESFENGRNTVQLNKVNVGNINRRAVYKAFQDYLTGSRNKGWEVYFGAEK